MHFAQSKQIAIKFTPKKLFLVHTRVECKYFCYWITVVLSIDMLSPLHCEPSLWSDTRMRVTRTHTPHTTQNSCMRAKNHYNFRCLNNKTLWIIRRYNNEWVTICSIILLYCLAQDTVCDNEFMELSNHRSKPFTKQSKVLQYHDSWIHILHYVRLVKWSLRSINLKLLKIAHNHRIRFHSSLPSSP